MPGPAPKPTALKILTGNRGHRPLNDQEPKPDLLKETPDPPYYLTTLAKRHWKERAPVLAKLGLLTEADLTAFTILCEYYSLWRYAYAKSRKKGGIEHETPNGHKQTSHFVTIARDAGRDYNRLNEQFGGVPSARAKFHVDKPKVEKNDFEDV